MGFRNGKTDDELDRWFDSHPNALASSVDDPSRSAELGVQTSQYQRAHIRAMGRHRAQQAADARAQEIINATARIRQARTAAAKAEAAAVEHERNGRPATAMRIRIEVIAGHESRIEKETWRLEQLASGDRAELKRLRRAAGLE